MVKSFLSNHIGENTFVLNDGNEAAIIDCGAYSEKQWEPILRYIKENNLNVRYALQTHTHFDHIYGLRFVERDLGIKAMCHNADKWLYDHANETTMALMGETFPTPQPEIDATLHDGQLLKLGTLTIEVLHTPGHTEGGVCFYIEQENIVFCGDTLFAGSIGRTDFPGGNFEMEISSIRERLLTLPPDTIAYPGHGPQTTIQQEISCNPYF